MLVTEISRNDQNFRIVPRKYHATVCMRGSRNCRPRGGGVQVKSNGQFQRNLSFFKVQEGVKHFPGGGEGGVQLFLGGGGGVPVAYSL